MKQIKLTQRQIALVSNEDYEWLSQWKWFFDRHHSGISGYALRKQSGRRIRMHIVVAQRMGLIGRVDHKNRNKLDNQRHNLRLATASQDAANRGRRQSNKTSNFRGVSWYSLTNRWHAQITAKSRVRHIGYFEGTPSGERKAAKAYNREAQKEFGEFAHLNKV